MNMSKLVAAMPKGMYISLYKHKEDRADVIMEDQEDEMSEAFAKQLGADLMEITLSKKTQ